MKVAVIGGSGFIGTSLCAKLVENGDKIVIIDKEKSDAYPEHWVYANVRDLDSVTRAVTGCDVIYNLAAEHRDDVRPKSLYEEVNVAGAENVCAAAETAGIETIIFTSSVAVYGFALPATDETGKLAPFNEYGKTKLKAEAIYADWCRRNSVRKLVIVRPTVVFGPRNRGNVYNLLKQIASERFMMIGKGTNVKSMAYVENVASFLSSARSFPAGLSIRNYVDKPDLDMNTLVSLVQTQLKIKKRHFRLPYRAAYFAGLSLDLVSVILGRRFAVSAIRIRKFCSTTWFNSMDTSFKSPVPLVDGIRRTVEHEFGREKHQRDGVKLFFTE